MKRFLSAFGIALALLTGCEKESGVLIGGGSGTGGSTITYTSNDWRKVDVQSWGWDAEIVSHTCEEGKGEIRFARPIPYIISDAFEECINLQSIVLPKGVTEILSGAFYGCSNLQTILLPEGLTHIQWSAFSGCTSLREVRLPATIEYLDNWAFFGGIQTIYCAAKVPPKVQEGTFDSEDIVYVPKESLAIYQQAADWQGHNILAYDFAADKPIQEAGVKSGTYYHFCGMTDTTDDGRTVALYDSFTVEKQSDGSYLVYSFLDDGDKQNSCFIMKGEYEPLTSDSGYLGLYGDGWALLDGTYEALPDFMMYEFTLYDYVVWFGTQLPWYNDGEETYRWAWQSWFGGEEFEAWHQSENPTHETMLKHDNTPIFILCRDGIPYAFSCFVSLEVFDENDNAIGVLATTFMDKDSTISISGEGDYSGWFYIDESRSELGAKGPRPLEPAPTPKRLALHK